jgi:hypothetical protein
VIGLVLAAPVVQRLVMHARPLESPGLVFPLFAAVLPVCVGLGQFGGGQAVGEEAASCWGDGGDGWGESVGEPVA